MSGAVTSLVSVLPAERTSPGVKSVSAELPGHGHLIVFSGLKTRSFSFLTENSSVVRPLTFKQGTLDGRRVNRRGKGDYTDLSSFRED